MADTTTRIELSDEVDQGVRIRIEALNQLVQLYQGSGRATVKEVLENVARFEKYITTGGTT